MRSIFVLLLVSTAFIACKNSTEPVDLGNQQAVRKALSNKWESEYIEDFASRTKVQESLIMHAEYKEDGTYVTGKKDGMMKTTSKWNYDPKEHFIRYSSGDRNYFSRVLKLTGNELILSQYTIMNDVAVDSSIVTYKKL